MQKDEVLKIKMKYGLISPEKTDNSELIKKIDEIVRQSKEKKTFDVKSETAYDKRPLLSATRQVEEKKKVGIFGDSMLGKVGNFLTSSSQKLGETVGSGLAAISPSVSKQREEVLKTQQDTYNNYIKLAQKTTDKNKKANYLKAAQNAADISGIDVYQDPVFQKTKKQILGEAIGSGLEALSGGMMTKGSPVLGKTAGKSFLRGALKQIPEAAITGAASGVGISLQEGKTVKESLESGLIGAGIGAGIGGLLGGLSARSQFLAPNKAAAIKTSAIEQYKKGLQATKEKYKEKTDKIIPQLLDRKWWGTRKSLLEKAEKGVSMNQDEYNKLGELVGVSNIKGLIKNIDDEIGKYTLASGRITSVNQGRVKALQDVRADILAVDALDNIKDNVASQQKLRELAQEYGREIYETRRSQKTIADNKTLSQVKKVDGMIRSILNKDPRNIKYSEINKQFFVNNELADILGETAKRQEGQKVMNIIRTLSGSGGLATGAATGGLPGAIIGGVGLTAFTEIINSTWWNTLRAVQKNALADKILAKSKEGMSKSLQFIAKQGIIGVNKILNQ